MMAARDHAGTNAFRDPRFDHEMADIGLHPQQVACVDAAKTSCIQRMYPERIGVRDLVEPLRVGAARVYLDRHPKGGDEDHLVLVQLIGMDMALDVARDRVLGPAPVREGGRVELEPPTWGRKA